MDRGLKVIIKHGGAELEKKINLRSLSIIVKKIGGRNIIFPKVNKNINIRVEE